MQPKIYSKVIWYIFVLQLIFNVFAIEIQYQDDIIKPAKMIMLSSQNLVMAERNIDQNFIIKQPLSLSMVYSTKIQSQNKNIKCSIVDWPIYKQTSLYYNIEYKEQKEDEQLNNPQIVSATFYKDSEYFVFFILTTMGKIQIVKKHPFNFSQTIKIYQCFENMEITQFDGFDEAYLYNTKRNIYLYVGQLVYEVKFQESNNKFTLTLLDLFKEKVKQVVQAQDKLYLLNEKSQIWVIQKDSKLKYFSTQDISIDNNSLQFKSVRLQKITIDQGIVYALDKQNGILRINFNNQLTILKIQHSNFAVGVNVYKKTMIVTYLIRQQTYLTEYFLQVGNSNNKGVHLNKIYTNFKDIRSVIIMDKYFLVGTQSQLIVAMHSINRNNPLIFHQKSESLSNQYMDQIYELHSILNGEYYPLSYMIVLKKSLSIIQFYQNQRLKYKQSWIQCKASQIGQHKITVLYQGLCANQKQSSKSGYCQMAMNVKIDIKDTTNQTNTNQWKLILVLLGLLIVTAIVGLILKKYFMKKQKIIQQKLIGKEKANNGNRGVSKQLIQFQVDKTNEFNISQIQDG